MSDFTSQNDGDAAAPKSRIGNGESKEGQSLTRGRQNSRSGAILLHLRQPITETAVRALAESERSSLAGLTAAPKAVDRRFSTARLTRILRWRFFRFMHEKSAIDPQVKYKRIVLKLRGEVLRGGKTGDPIDR